MSSASVLLELLGSVPDPRRRRGIRHGLPGMLAVAISAVVAGAKSFAAIGQWVAELDAVLGAWMWTRTHVVDRRRVIAVDGKTVRGARTPHRGAPHLVAAFEHGSGTVLGQLAVAAKSNEIPAVRTLLGGFDLDGVVVTMDAMHTPDRHRRAHRRRWW